MDAQRCADRVVRSLRQFASVRALANDTKYGLNGSVWSRRSAHAVRVAERLQLGTVNVNESYAATRLCRSVPFEAEVVLCDVD